jgi:hypothetical protein
MKPKCANCKEEHPAWSKKCAEYQKEKARAMEAWKNRPQFYREFARNLSNPPSEPSATSGESATSRESGPSEAIPSTQQAGQESSQRTSQGNSQRSSQSSSQHSGMQSSRWSSQADPEPAAPAAPPARAARGRNPTGEEWQIPAPPTCQAPLKGRVRSSLGTLS